VFFKFNSFRATVLVTPALWGVSQMRKLLALALLALALAGGVAFVAVEHSTPAAACENNNC
jgi:hypothetical protein